jgi:hypothetical protein
VHNSGYKKLIEHANKLALKKPDLNLLRSHPRGEYSIMAQALETLLQERNAKRLLVLPDLTAFSNDALGVFSDYSGEDHSARYLTYSVLVCGYRYTGAFSDRMKRVRETYKLGDKEIAYKDFRMGQIQASLGDYLSMRPIGCRGFYALVAIDKRIPTLFGPLNDPSVPDMLVKILDEYGARRTRKPREVEKLLRIVHMVAYLIALLGVDGQKIFWMSDHDATCANPKQHESMMAVLQTGPRDLFTPRCDLPFARWGSAVQAAKRRNERSAQSSRCCRWLYCTVPHEERDGTERGPRPQARSGKSCHLLPCGRRRRPEKGCVPHSF